MAKAKTAFVCGACGAVSPRWQGRCAACGEWNTLAEERVEAGRTRGPAAGARPAATIPRVADLGADTPLERWSTGLGEVDGVLGGGIVRGAVTLLAGDPGIGKSTLLLQVLAGVAAQGRATLYVTGEESAEQVAMRARRVAPTSALDIAVLATTRLEDVLEVLERGGVDLVVIDSVQTLHAEALESSVGSVAQLREVSSRLTDLAKRRGIALWLVGHVTKEGAIAGPKVLEHLVDTVLSFEGDGELAFRVLRSSKNRFGAVHEIGIFEMRETGLAEVRDASAQFLRERASRAAGSVVTAVLEGSRPLLMEVQALVAPAVYGSARRVTAGIDSSRTALLLAVLDRKAGVHVVDQDVFVSTAGGLRTQERAADLAVSLALVSSFRNRAVDASLVAVGEVGLTGEVRGVARLDARLKEAARFGFRRALVPASALEGERLSATGDLECVGVASLEAALDAAF